MSRFDDLIIKLKPLTYKESTVYGLENFSLQRQLAQVDSVTDDAEKQKNERNGGKKRLP